jgi:DNA-binding CsgD family transcriptional regulator
MDSHFKVFNDDKGELGAVYTAAVHKGILYLGTNQGLFYKSLNKNEKFKFIEGTQGQVWCLLELDEKLFCGHNSGTFVVENDKVEKISDIQGTWNIKSIENKPNILIQGNYNGLYILKKKNNKWGFSHKIEGFDISSRFFEFLSEKEIFVSHEYKGVLRIDLNDDYTKALEIAIEPISKGLKSSLSKYNNNILYAYKDGIFKYDDSVKQFLKDTLLMNLYNSKSFVSGKLIVEPKTNRLWGFSSNEIRFISPGKLSKTPEVNSIPLPYELRKSTISFENVISVSDQHYLLGTTSGYILINLEKPFNKEYNARINSITKNKYRTNGVFEYVDKSLEGNFLNDENNIEISYSIPEYNKYLKVEYQYQLIGIYDNWSEWSSNSKELFENLPYGDYTFNVRGRINNSLTQNTATYSFIIQRPWHLSNLMIAVYIISLILFSSIMHNIYKQYYKRQRKLLLEQKNKELELKELANQEQSMRFENESLTKDIESKNRELAISTMSLIKKNEFLNSIKEELINTKESNVKPVIKIIDKNLNNTDDWKLFQEAFNNADKDFLKKIKNIHPSLTPNDLRLCAYLRLNLSSKEIAPLLNISPRSVEVKRYRLRKKINLPHESSLTNYIIEL